MNSIRRIFLVSGFPLVLLLLAIAASLYSKRYIGDFTRDPTAVAGVPFYVGFISNLGVLLWWTSAVVGIGAAFCAWQRSDSLRWVRFFTLFGMFSALLALDDLFQLHENLFPSFLGVPEKVVIASYGVLLAALLSGYFDIIRSTDSFYLWFALTLFALSVGIDRVPGHILPYHHLFEDGFKFLGISGWLGFIVQTAYLRLTTSLDPREAAATESIPTEGPS